jgi:hypothetical protein
MWGVALEERCQAVKYHTQVRLEPLLLLLC